MTDTSKALEPLLKSAVGKEQAGIVGKLTTILFATDSILGILGYRVVTNLPSFFAVGGSIVGITLVIVGIIIIVAVKMPLQSVEGAALADLEKAKLSLGTKSTPDAEQVKGDSVPQKLATIPEKPKEIESDAEDEETEPAKKPKPSEAKATEDDEDDEDLEAADVDDTPGDDKQQNEE